MGHPTGQTAVVDRFDLSGLTAQQQFFFRNTIKGPPLPPSWVAGS
jgi:hypothetical protein